MDPKDNYRVFHQNVKEYTFYLAAQGNLSSIDHIMSHKTNLNKFRNIEITIMSNHNAIKQNQHQINL